MEDMYDDLHLIAPDLRGFGKSSYNTPIRSIDDLAKDVDLFCAALGLKNLIVIGWSMGGAVACKLAAKYSYRVWKLILVNHTRIRGFPI
mmetsp:Transcript_40777/g.36196  ORF Transcript_40777/g.36196 Transcript_40777/m.36196 type:complete len:89 (+) Transcript_40777:200-466(+)